MSLPLVDPRAKLLRDPSLLREPTTLTDPRVLAAPDLVPDEEWRHLAEHNSFRTLGDIGMGLAIAFQVMRILARGWLLSLTPPKNSVDGVIGLGGTFAGAGAQPIIDQVNRFRRQYQLMVTPAIRQAFTLGDTRTLTDAEEDTFATHYAGQLFDYINASSGEAVMDSYAAQLRDRWSSDLAWQRALQGYGLDRRSMTGYTRMLLKPDAGAQLIPAAASRFVTTALAARAETLSREEARQAQQMGKALRWMLARQRGLLPADARRKWLTADDEKVCPVCGPMDGVSVDLSERFTLPNKTLTWVPGVHPNCRCEMVLDYPRAGIELLNKAWYDEEPRDPHGQWTAGGTNPNRLRVLEEAPVAVPQVTAPIAVPQPAAPISVPRVAAPVAVPVIAAVAVPSIQAAAVSVPVIAPVANHDAGGGGDGPDEAPAYYALADDAIRTRSGDLVSEDDHEYLPGDEVHFGHGASVVRAATFHGHLETAEAAHEFYESLDPDSTPPLDHYLDPTGAEIGRNYDVLVDEIHAYALQNSAAIIAGDQRRRVAPMSTDVLHRIYANAGKNDLVMEFPETMLRDNLIEAVDTQSDPHLADSYLTAIELGWHRPPHTELDELFEEKLQIEDTARYEGHRVEIPKVFIFQDHEGDLEDAASGTRALIRGKYYVTHVQVMSTRVKSGGDSPPAMIPALELVYLQRI